MANLAGIFDKAFDNAKMAAERVTFPVRLAEKDALQDQFASPCQINPFEVPLAEKVDFLKELEADRVRLLEEPHQSLLLDQQVLVVGA